MKSIEHLIIALVCYVVIAYHYIYNFSIITDPYMFWVLMILFGVGGWNLGIGLGKLFKEIKR